MILARRLRSASACRGDGPDHALVDVHVLDLDIGDLDTPGVGLRVEDLLDVAVQLVALGQHLVELVLAEHRAKRGLCELARGRMKFSTWITALSGSTTRK